MKEIERRLSRLEAGTTPQELTTIDLDLLTPKARREVEAATTGGARLDPAKLSKETLRELLDLRKVELPTEIWLTSPVTEDNPSPNRTLIWRHPDHQPDPE